MTDAAPLPPGTVVGRYRIEQPLALSGPDGPAYRGRDAASQRRVVILEFLPPGLARRAAATDLRVAPLDADMRPLFAAAVREIQALALDFGTFRHPNVLVLLDCFAANDTVYLVTEMPDGRGLDRLLGPGETLLPDEVQEILPSLLAGADAIHKAGLLHLDLCPAAIWIRRDGTAALGRAHLVRRTLGAPGRADSSSPRDAYRAEEYFLPDGKLGPWTDIYAIAATLFRLAAGKPPPDPLSRRRALQSGQSDPVGAQLDAAMGAWPVPLIAAIRHGLALAPGNRPQSVAALRAALGAAGQGEIPTVPLREPGFAGGEAEKPGADAGRTKQVFPERHPDDAPTVRMERNPAAAQPVASAAPVPRRAQSETVPPSEAPTVRMARTPAPSAAAPRRDDDATEPPRHGAALAGADPDATKPMFPPRLPKQLSGPAPGSGLDDLPTVRMPQRAARAAPPIVAPPVLPNVDGGEKKTTVIYRRGRAEVITAPPASARPDSRPETPASDSEPAIHPARFSVFSPMLMTPSQWLDLAVYIHEPGIDSFVRQDHLARYEGRPGETPERRSALRYSLKPGAAVTVVPYLPGCRVNPPRATAEFWENFHRLPFRVMASPGAPDYAEGAQAGAVFFFVGPLLVGEARLAFTIGREKAHPISNTTSLAADTFDAVFPCFAPQDGEVADRFAAVAAQVDNPFLAEILALRGRDWDREILQRIEAAERFQLFWSSAAGRSPHLEEEWKFALALGREHFIRAFYWRHPAPGLPEALGEAAVALRHLTLTLE